MEKSTSSLLGKWEHAIYSTSFLFQFPTRLSSSGFCLTCRHHKFCWSKTIKEQTAPSPWTPASKEPATASNGYWNAATCTCLCWTRKESSQEGIAANFEEVSQNLSPSTSLSSSSWTSLEFYFFLSVQSCLLAAVSAGWWSDSTSGSISPC